MSDMIINLHLRETDDGSFLATLKDRPGLEVRGSTAGEAIEKAKNQLQSESKRPKPESGGMEEDELLRQVMVLEHVEREDNLSQRRLAKLMNLNLSTVNQIVKRLVKKGYVKTRRLNGRSVAYYLTPQGFSEKLRLVMAYTRLTISFFANVRELVNLELARLKEEQGITSVSIIGTGELAEAVYLSAREQGLEIAAIHDEKKAGETWLGHEITWPVMTADNNGKSKTALIHAEMKPDTEASQETCREQDRPIIDLAHLLSERMGHFAERIDGEVAREPLPEPKIQYGVIDGS